MSRRRIPDHVWAEARARWERGEKAAPIAAALGVSIDAVYWRRSMEGWTQRGKVRRIVTPEAEAKARELWIAGAPGAECAKAMGITASHVWEYASNWPRRPDPRRNPRWAEAREAYERGVSAKNVGALIGVTDGSVYAMAKSEGWKRPKGYCPGGASKPVIVTPPIPVAEKPDITPADDRCPRCRAELPESKICRRCANDILGAVPSKYPGDLRRAS